MTVEYILLLTLFVTLLMGTVLQAPKKAFENAGPKLGARIERHLMTGDGFGPEGSPIQWEEPK